MQMVSWVPHQMVLLVVGKKHLLEVKSYSARDYTIQEATNAVPGFCLEVSQDNSSGYGLKRDHVYWHQVQGQMHIAKREFCFFVVWTTKDTAVITIKRDELWGSNTVLLTDFYKQHIFPKVVQGEL